ncbi:MAG: hypothetical protein AAF633_26625 [Chloroflexota bacterium]
MPQGVGNLLIAGRAIGGDQKSPMPLCAI